MKATLEGLSSWTTKDDNEQIVRDYFCMALPRQGHKFYFYDKSGTKGYHDWPTGDVIEFKVQDTNNILVTAKIQKCVRHDDRTNGDANGYFVLEEVEEVTVYSVREQ